MPGLDRLRDSDLCDAGKLYKQGACVNGKVEFRVAVQRAPRMVGPCSVMNGVGGKVVWRKARVSGADMDKSAHPFRPSR
jgi:hypothetical protein